MLKVYDHTQCGVPEGLRQSVPSTLLPSFKSLVVIPILHSLSISSDAVFQSPSVLVPHCLSAESDGQIGPWPALTIAPRFNARSTESIDPLVIDDTAMTLLPIFRDFG